ncbi:MAG: ABC transporter permease subunit [Thermoanaerobaculia bacterium]
MAVYGRSYRRYSGVLTPAWTRFLIFPRYAYETVFQSKLFVAFFALCFLVPFAGLLIIYLHHNMSALSFMNLPAEELKQFIPIDKKFFMMGTWLQGGLSFLLALLIGPALVSPDLRNNGLALYLSRPFSRSEYVLGKTSVLLILMSAITWIPGMLLYFFQAYLEGAGWLATHLRLGFAIFVGSWAWILFLSILTLAVSAWVKWRPVARIALIVIFFVSMGFAGMIGEILDTSAGTLVAPWFVIGSIWGGLFDVPVDDFMPSPGAAWVSLITGTLVCLWLLSRRIRAYEVVR